MALWLWKFPEQFLFFSGTTVRNISEQKWPLDPNLKTRDIQNMKEQYYLHSCNIKCNKKGYDNVSN